VKIPNLVVEWNNLLRNSEVVPENVKLLVAQDHFYGRMGYTTINIKLELLARDIAVFLEKKGAKAICFPATYAQDAYIMEKIPGFYAPFSHRHAAVRAGLGEFGLNNLVLTPQYGPRQRFNSIITDADLEPDPIISKKICLRDKCLLCIKECGAQALKLRTDQDQEEIFLDPPSITNKEACYNLHRKKACWGRCISVCPIGKFK
jgi:epoxyqueuosine reductase QueG